MDIEMESVKMKKLMTAFVILLSLVAVGCDNEDTIIVQEIDAVPATPQGVFSITGNSSVLILFNGIYEHDVDFYTVYRSNSAADGYVALADVNALANPNLDLLIYEYFDINAENARTYYYAVTATDHAGQESDLSAEDVFDTPRPEGNVTLLPMNDFPTVAGFNLAAAVQLDWDSELTDVWLDTAFIVDGIDTTWISYLNAGLYTPNPTDIQDMGFTTSFDDISYAPADGWSQLGYVEAIVGHTYVIWTSDDNFAKLRINSISASGAVAFRWAYQEDVGNLELAPPVRPERDRDLMTTKTNTVVTQLLK
jgi:hypothetical protein